MHAMSPRIRGLTLIELLIVVVIVALLAAIAYPNYRDFVARSKRNEAKAALLQIATQQERVYLNTNSYTENMTELGFSLDDDWPTESGTYTVDVGSADGNNFTATATYNADGDKEAGRCKTFQIDARGQRTSAPAADCWTRTR